ncbi:MAG: GNAT family N-acetyltransferase [Acidimicrobiales bacterium]|nr:GNAT family N-acetyltransferase [Acidimicrobiales bacterium]
MSDVEVRELRDDEHAAWDREVDAWDGRPVQTTWWAAPLARYGIGHRVIGRFERGELTGGVLVRVVRMPGLPVTMLDALRGPLGADWTDEQVRSLVDQVQRLVEEQRSVQVTFQAVPDPVLHSRLRAELARRRGGVTTYALPAEAIIDLRGRTLDDVVADFGRTPKRHLRVATRSAIEVRDLTAADELDQAYDCFAASAERQGFVELRPRDALVPMLRHGADTGAGLTLGAMADGEVVAATFVTMVGPIAEYLYGGYRTDTVGGAKVHPSLAVHAEGIARAIAAGKAGYSLGLVGATASSAGVDRFKRGVGAVEVPTSEAITWTVRPWAARLLTAMRTTSWGKRVVKRVRRAAVRRGARPVAADG